MSGEKLRLLALKSMMTLRAAPCGGNRPMAVHISQILRAVATSQATPQPPLRLSMHSMKGTRSVDSHNGLATECRGSAVICLTSLAGMLTKAHR